jgi:hypothetical protein
MITPRLETAILNGWATYSKVSHALGMFGSIVVPDGATFVIVDLKWFPFLDPIRIMRDGPGGPTNVTTWRDLFRYNEYQLKIESKISTNFLQFRNEFDYKLFGEGMDADISALISSAMDGTGTFTGNEDLVTGDFSGTSTNHSSGFGSLTGSISGTAINLDDPIDYTLLKNHFLPIQKAPILQDVYFVCEKFIKLTISRNCFIYNLTDQFAPMNSIANENPTPNGVQNVSVLLRSQMYSPSLQNQFYYPPDVANSGVGIGAQRTMEAYKQDLDPTYSALTDPDSAKGFINADFPYQTLPLVEFGIVTINKEYFDKIMNS